MRAVVYKKPFEVAVEEVPDPQVEHPNDVIVRIASTAICGSDLHMHEGRMAVNRAARAPHYLSWWHFVERKRHHGRRSRYERRLGEQDQEVAATAAAAIK